MILEVALTALLLYLGVGAVICVGDPLTHKRKAELFPISMTFAISGKSVPGKLFAFRALQILGIVLLWSLFLFHHHSVALFQCSASGGRCG